MVRFAPIAFVMLAACASQEDRCIKAAQADLTALDARIAQLETDIARGFRTAPNQTTVGVGVRVCSGDNVRICVGGNRETPPRTVAVDREAEQRVLESLLVQRAEVQLRTASAISACRAGA